jgi:uroporphyrin-III C-methyltransferase/precorrin-2 dehydrogenase/sirohydrochlorin ferrochelatase
MNARFKIESSPPRIDALARLPVFLALEGKRALVAGGTAAAAWKAELLAAAGACVHVLAETFSHELHALAASSGEISLHARGWRPEDLAGAALAIGDFACNDEAARFAQAARAAGVLVNVIDRPAYCDFSFGAIVNRSPLVIGISTGGAAPAFAQAIRSRIEALIPRGFAGWAAAAQRWRARMGSYRLSAGVRRRFWQNFAAFAMAQPERAPQTRNFADLLDETVRDDASGGSVTVLSSVPCDAEHLTLGAIRALACADIIFIDAEVSAGVIEFARREAERIFARGMCDDEIADQMRRLAQSGKRVVLLSPPNKTDK